MGAQGSSLRLEWLRGNEEMNERRGEASFKDVYEFGVLHVKLETLWDYPHGIISHQLGNGSDGRAERINSEVTSMKYWLLECLLPALQGGGKEGSRHSSAFKSLSSQGSS